MVTRSLSISSNFSENSTGHVFHLFRLIFFGVSSFVLLSKGKISKKYNKKVEISQKTTTAQKIEKKRGAKEEQYLEEHIEKTKVSCVSVCCLVPYLCYCFHPPYLFFIHLSPCYPPYFCHTPGIWNILDQQREQVL